MKKCKYCSFEENGDASRNREYLFWFPVLTIGDSEIYVNGGIYGSGEQKYLVFSWAGPHGTEDAIESVPINYCPICGRKLWQEVRK